MAIKINGVDLETSFGFKLSDVVGLSPPRVRSNLVPIPGRHGALDFGGTFEPRDIILEGSLLASLNHDDMIGDLRSLVGASSLLPMGLIGGTIFGLPLSQTSAQSTIELTDYTNVVFNVVHNGLFEVDYIGPRFGTAVCKIRIGFRQVDPWALSTVPLTEQALTSSNSGYFRLLNENGLHVPPTIVSTSLGTTTVFQLISIGVDPFNTKNIVGTVGGNPVFNTAQDAPGVINGAFNYSVDGNHVSYSITDGFSQEHGSIELLYLPIGNNGSVSATLWTIYNDATHYWRCWYDSVSQTFKFGMRDGGAETTIDSGWGIFSLASVHRITCYWSEGFAYISRDDKTRVSGSQLKLSTYPTTMRIGSFGDGTLPAKGIIEEFIIWNRDLGQEYNDHAYKKRINQPFGRPVPGVLLYANFDFLINATGCGNRVLTYTGTLDNLDRVFIDMENRTAAMWDDSAQVFTPNIINNVSGNFFDLVPGVNTLRVTKTGAGNIRSEFTYARRFLI